MDISQNVFIEENALINVGRCRHLNMCAVGALNMVITTYVGNN